MRIAKSPTLARIRKQDIIVVLMTLVSETNKDFSIIIPLHNASRYVSGLLDNLSQLDFDSDRFEVIFVDDNSTDDTRDKLKQFVAISEIKSKIFAAASNGGPGSARNIGVREATGAFIVFLDADDLLSKDLLKKLSFEIAEHKHKVIDVLYFDFENRKTDFDASLVRRDYRNFRSKKSLINGHLNGTAYQECMFASYSKEFLRNSGITFQEGFYEDICFSLEVALNLKEFIFITDKLYVKNAVEGSVTSNISERHVKSFVNSIENCQLVSEGFGVEYDVAAAISGRIRSICQLRIEHERAIRTIAMFIDLLDSSKIGNWRKCNPRNSNPIHLYATIFNKFARLSSADKKQIEDFYRNAKDDFGKSWGCIDLQDSVFLAPNEIRTCCKRFFRNGSIAGDVVLQIDKVPIPLSDNPNDYRINITSRDIQTAKRDLVRDINTGADNPCSGCPFLRFDNWANPENLLAIKYLSMEQHSVCNLRCTYCDEKYYGGMLPAYEVPDLISDFAKNGHLDNIETVVWGGGEPTLDPKFQHMVTVVSEMKRDVSHRFLSNSLRYSSTVKDSLANGNSILVTSIDAGSEETYLSVRGKRGFNKVFTNLSKYAIENSDSIIIKYIFTNDNINSHEIDGFLLQVQQFNLLDCFFQISYDFKNEWISDKGFLACLEMYSKLYKAGAKLIFLDDLILMRVKNWKNISKIIEGSGKEFDRNCIAQPDEFNPITLFGGGQQARIAAQTLKIFERYPVTKIAFTKNHESSGDFLNIPRIELQQLAGEESFLYLVGVQTMPILYRQVLKSGIDRNRILRKLLL